MSKNLTRKGLAFGALVALASSVIAGAPALADNNGPITLLPNGGTGTNATFNSIIGAGITLTATLDPGIQGLTTGVSATLEGPAAKGSYLISNPSGAKITVSSTTPDAFGYFVFNSDGNSAVPTSDGAAALSASTTLATVNDYNWSAGAVVDSTLAYVDIGTATLTTTATKILVRAALKGSADSGASDDTINPIKIDAAGTSAVALTVQSFTDTDTAGTSTTAKIGPFEKFSKAETVNLYPLGSVSATTTITQLERGASAGTTTSKFLSKVVYGSSINPYAVASLTTVKLRKDGGDPLYLNPNSTPNNSTAEQVNAVPFAAASTLVSTAHYKTNSETATTDTAAALALFATGVYSAQAYFNGLTVGAASAVVDLNAGSNSTVAGVKVSALATKDQTFTATNDTAKVSAVRATTKTATFSVTAQNNTADTGATVESANIEVKAVSTATKLNTGSSVTATGSAAALAATDDVTTSYLRTGSNGKVDFTLTNTVGKADDKITTVFSVKNSAGVWVDATTVVTTWASAALTTFTAKPGTYVSGATVNVTFTAKDQFGEGLDSTTDGALSVIATAYVAGVESKTTYTSTVATASGKAAFSFANFAVAGGSAVLKAKLYAGTTDTTKVVDVNVYNTYATGSVNTATSYSTDITYNDFVTGDASDSAIAKKVSDAGIATSVNITGTVLNVNNVGQPGVAVVVEAPGVLFKAGTVWAQDKITAYADEFGNFTVGVAAHLVNTTGATVTITADGKSTTTSLKTYLPANLVKNSNLKFSWALPTVFVKNTTYPVVATLVDKWGNPIKTAGATGSVRFDANGSLEVNGLATVTKDFDKTGKVTVFVRSVADIAGPGSLTATLLVVASQYAIDPTVAEDSLGFDQFASLSSITTDVTSTVWDETLFNKELTATVNVEDAVVVEPVATVNTVGHRVYVKVDLAKGKEISAVIGGVRYTKTALYNPYVISRWIKTAGKVAVKVYVDGDLVKASTQTVK
jgi:hypothetical protein